MGEVYEALAYRLVELDSVTLLDKLADDLALVVLHDEHFLGAHHLFNHDDAEIGEDLLVLVLPQRVVVEQRRIWCSGRCQGAHGEEGVGVCEGQRLHLLVELLHELEPVVEADFEDFSVVNLRDADEVKMGVGEKVAVWQVLDKLSSD